MEKIVVKFKNGEIKYFSIKPKKKKEEIKTIIYDEIYFNVPRHSNKIYGSLLMLGKKLGIEKEIADYLFGNRRE